MNETEKTPLTIVGVPMDLGAENLGVSMGTDTYRYQGIVEKLESAGFSVQDMGNVPVKDRHLVPVGNPRLRRLDEVVAVSEKTAGLVDQAVRSGSKAVVLGGDHSIFLGACSGASVAVDGKIGVIYLDAHGDMNTDDNTPTGNIHGMQLASVMGFGSPALAHVYGEQIKLPKENLLHIAGCDLDQSEIDLIRDENLAAFTMLDLMKYGLAPLLDKIDELAARVENIWVSIDLDSIDAVYAPGAGMPNKKGLTYREVTAIAEHIASKANVIGVDVVEYNPLQDIEGKTGELAVELIATLLGGNYSWYTHYLERNKN